MASYRVFGKPISDLMSGCFQQMVSSVSFEVQFVDEINEKRAFKPCLALVS